MTVDSHLHRRLALSELCTIPAAAVQAAPALADWIAAKVDQPLLIGPDSESAQRVAAIAARTGAPGSMIGSAVHRQFPAPPGCPPAGGSDVSEPPKIVPGMCGANTGPVLTAPDAGFELKRLFLKVAVQCLGISREDRTDDRIVGIDRPACFAQPFRDGGANLVPDRGRIH